MPKRPRKTKKQIQDERSVEIEQIYDLDEFVGEGWKNQFDDILNKRYADGWEYIPPYYIIGLSKDEYDKELGQPARIYGVLYKKKRVNYIGNYEDQFIDKAEEKFKQDIIKSAKENNKFQLDE